MLRAGLDTDFRVSASERPHLANRVPSSVKVAVVTRIYTLNVPCVSIHAAATTGQ